VILPDLTFICMEAAAVLVDDQQDSTHICLCGLLQCTMMCLRKLADTVCISMSASCRTSASTEHAHLGLIPNLYLSFVTLTHRGLPIIAGARDGALMVWDIRCQTRTSPHADSAFHSPVLTVHVRPCLYLDRARAVTCGCMWEDSAKSHYLPLHPCFCRGCGTESTTPCFRAPSILVLTRTMLQACQLAC
jgi:hypothetical protein